MPASGGRCETLDCFGPWTVTAAFERSSTLHQSSQGSLARESVRAYHGGRCPVRGVVSAGPDGPRATFRASGSARLFIGELPVRSFTP